jgi:hypothetical protein
MVLADRTNPRDPLPIPDRQPRLDERRFAQPQAALPRRHHFDTPCTVGKPVTRCDPGIERMQASPILMLESPGCRMK